MFKLQNVFLIGPVGAGKTTIGHCLAKELKKKFYDTDKEIELRAGVDIPWIFDVEGEDKFRQREAAVIEELTQLQNIILATGGGAILEPSNRKNLAGRGTVVYLDVSLKQQLARIEHDTTRPLIQVQNRREILEQLKQERDPFYREIADVVFSTNSGNVRAVAQEILKYFQDISFGV